MSTTYLLLFQRHGEGTLSWPNQAKYQVRLSSFEVCDIRMLAVNTCKLNLSIRAGFLVAKLLEGMARCCVIK